MIVRMKASLFIGGLLLICAALFIYSLPLGFLGTGVSSMLVAVILEHEM